MADTMNEYNGVTTDREGTWKAFHQAYDSAMRTYRRGPEVSRAVNWLYVVSREEARPEEREEERRNRELGLKLGERAKSEVEIAPLVWTALGRNDRSTGSGNYLANADGVDVAPPAEGTEPATPPAGGSGGEKEPVEPVKPGVDGQDARPDQPKPSPGGEKQPSTAWEYIL